MDLSVLTMPMEPLYNHTLKSLLVMMFPTSKPTKNQRFNQITEDIKKASIESMLFLFMNDKNCWSFM